MEPRQPGPGTSFEHTLSPPQVGEGYGLSGGEVQPGYEHGAERVGERPAALEVESAAPAVPILPVPLLPQVTDGAAAVVGPAPTVAPDTAADEDLIEKEWVDKAKKIIEETKDDPYRRELEIGKLQREYIMKRYGREIGESGD